jgi:SAM-dependent methyltransferase
MNAHPTPHIAAIIGHADGETILEDCIRHHLSIGVRHVMVVMNEDEAVGPAAFDGDKRVRAVHASRFAGDDRFSYFSAAVRELQEWVTPEWIFFTDSDEFWLPQSGMLTDLALADKDLLIVERFNTPVLRGRDGQLVAPDLSAPALLPLISQREVIDDQYLSGDTQTPWIMGLDAPKLMVRPELVASAGAGAHSIVATNPGLRWHMPDDLLILHAPFTTEARFAKKVARIREIFKHVGERFNARQAWHWRYWQTLTEAGVSAEFQRQSFRASAVPALLAQGVLALPETQYAILRKSAGSLQGDALQEALGRAVQNYVRPTPGGPAPVAPAAAAPAAPAARAEILQAAPERRIDNVEDCYFYHCMDIPGHGEVLGQWDLRGNEPTYLGHVPFYGKSVLEIGTASGYLGFWMERQGAAVTCYDLDHNEEWDIVDFAGHDRAQIMKIRKDIILKINNGWWFNHNRLKSRNQVVYGNVYELNKLPATFDIVTVNSVLLHLRDPFRALAQAAARTHDQIVVTDISERHFTGKPPVDTGQMSMHFLPRRANNGPVDTWWVVSEKLTAEFLRILGFKTIELTYHTQRFMPNEDWHLYTLVGKR